MANIRLDMTMSLDGYVAGPRDDADAPMGVGGFRLFNWLDHRDEPGPHGQVYSEALAASRCCGPGSSTSWSCTSYRSCSGKGAGCSTTCRRSTSSSTWSAG